MMVRLMFPLGLHNPEQRIAAPGAKNLYRDCRAGIVGEWEWGTSATYCLSNAL